jgi:hypothetical protein
MTSSGASDLVIEARYAWFLVEPWPFAPHIQEWT